MPAFAPTTARVGRSGISADRHEGDGTTPEGVFTLAEAFGNGPDPGTALGYRVVEAKNGIEACLLATQQAGSLQLLLTDVVMPGMGGRELAQHLSVIKPVWTSV